MYRSWENLFARCYNKNRKNYKNYGGRGITVSDEWHDFENFCRDMGYERPKGMTIDRIDNDKGYSKENCRWATPTQQNNNRRKSVGNVTAFGETKTLKEWAVCVGMNYEALKSRMKKGWDIEIALSKPVRYRKTCRKNIGKGE